MPVSQESELLEPSIFALPEDYEESPQDYEIWSIKVPVKFDMSCLNNIEFQFDLSEKQSKGKEKAVTNFEVNDTKYSMIQGNKDEVKTFRILTRVDEDEKEMIPSNVTFDKHYSIVETTNANVADVDLAPSNERAVGVDMKTMQMRIPYVPIPQKTGLKRRWNMMGANAQYTAPIKKENDAAIETPSKSVERSKKQKKEKKPEKKSKKKKSKQ